MGQLLKHIFFSPWFITILLFFSVFLGVKKLNFLQGIGLPKVKHDQNTNTFTPDNRWRNRLAWILGLSAAFGVPLLTRTGEATINVIGWVAGIVFGAVLVDQGFAKMRDRWIPNIKKAWQNRRANNGRKS